MIHKKSWLRVLNYRCGRIGVLFFKAKTLCKSFVIGARSITVDVTVWFPYTQPYMFKQISWIFKCSLRILVHGILLRHLQFLIVQSKSFRLLTMEEVGSNSRVTAKCARLRRKLILQGRCLKRSQPDSAKKTHIFNENTGFAATY